VDSSQQSKDVYSQVVHDLNEIDRFIRGI